MDMFHEFHLNMTRRRSDDSIKNWYDPYRLIAYTIGNEFNDFWYNCFRFSYDIVETYREKFDNFVDFGDIYLSFIFNMLSKSIEIKEDVESMIDAFDVHDTAKFVRGLASILRNVFDFESYQVAGDYDGNYLQNPTQLLHVKQIRESTKEERAAKWDAKVKASHKNLKKQRAEERKVIMAEANELIEQGVHPLVALQGKDYRWGAVEIVEAPFALLIGAMHALPQDSFGYKCSRNTTELRAELIKGINFSKQNEIISSAQSFYDGIKLFDEFGIFCMDAFIYDLGVDYWDDLFGTWYGVLENLAYNLGFMWTDVINYIFFTPETVPDNDFGFFTIYLAGDFIMRFFVADRTPRNEDDDEDDN